MSDLILKRGARPSPRHRLAGATPHQIRGVTPQNYIGIPQYLSFWGNQTDGDCVTAEEAFAKSCYGVRITDETVLAWAKKNSVLDGAELTQVMDLMQTQGFRQDGVTYNDGPPSAVDWTNPAVLQNALFPGPVKIAIAADQLEAVYQVYPSTGWIASGFKADQNYDHCVSLTGFGSLGWLAEQLKAPISSIDLSAQGYAMFTWNSIGIIDEKSLLCITGEAWVRNPTTLTPAVTS